MKIYAIVELHDLTKKLQTGERLKNYEYVQAAQSASEAITLKIKSFLIANSGEPILSMPTKLIFRISPAALDELEVIKKGYESTLKTPISIGIGQELSDAEKALARSVKSQEMEFWHPQEDKEEKLDGTDDVEDPNLVPDKAKVKEVKEPDPVTIEEELQALEGYKQALLQMIMAPMQQIQEEAQAQQEAQAQEQAQQQMSPEEQAQMEGEAQAQQEGEAQPQEEPDMREQMFAPQEEPQEVAEPLQQSDEKVEMDPAKAQMEKEEEPKESARDKVEGLLATIKLFMPEMLKIVEKNPDNSKVVMNMINSAIKLAKSVRDNGEELSKNFKKKSVKLAVGTIKDGKVKVKDPATGNTYWRGIRTGLMLGPDGEPLSTKVHNQISADNELGKEELQKDHKYTFAKKPDGAYYIFAHDADGNKVGHLKAEDYDDDIMVHHVKVEEPYRRKGIATQMYKILESKTGRKAIQDLEANSPDGQKLWSQPNRPFGKEELDKGAKGDWEKEGYTLHLEGNPEYGQSFTVFAQHPEHGHSGFAGFFHGDEGLHPEEVDVDPNHQRKGLASAMYKYAQRLTGRKVVPSEAQTPDAEALWSQPNRPFGKSEKLTAEQESEIIKENKKSPAAKKAHKFKAAKWTHPNGHPRCIICGDEERTDGTCEGRKDGQS